MEKYMLIVRGRPEPDLSPAEMQARVEEYRAWASGLGAQHREGKRLRTKGVLVRNSNSVVTDGPFLEAKEIIAGYVVLMARDLDDAIRIAQTCPLLEHSDLEVRPFLDQN